jgi:hypothetical protein
MTHKIPDLTSKIARAFGTPRLDLKRVPEALIVPACYMVLFYHLNLLVSTYLPGSNLIDLRLALILSALAITRTIFKESLISALAGLASVALMFNFLYQAGSLNQFGIIRTQTSVVTVTLKFQSLLMIILFVMILKTLLYTLEIIENSKVSQSVNP